MDTLCYVFTLKNLLYGINEHYYRVIYITDDPTFSHRIIYRQSASPPCKIIYMEESHNPPNNHTFVTLREKYNKKVMSVTEFTAKYFCDLINPC